MRNPNMEYNAFLSFSTLTKIWLNNARQFAGNTNGRYEKVRRKLPNGFGLYDLHGNVAELVVTTPTSGGAKRNYAVRGGSYKDKATKLHISSNERLDAAWKKRKEFGDSWTKEMSVWYSPSADHVGFRVVRSIGNQEKVDAACSR